MTMKAVICEVAGKGLGMIALEPLHPGQVLLRERPVIEVDMGAGSLDRREVALCYREQDWEQQGEKREFKKLARAFVALSSEEKSKVFSLTKTDTVKEGTLAMAWADLRRENIELDFRKFCNFIQTYVTNAFSDGLWPDLARVNHSCFPNAEVVKRGRERYLVVVRPVERGEEVTHSYLHSLMGRDARREVLERRWGFLCDCTLCCLPQSIRLDQESQRARFRAAESIWKQEGSRAALEEAISLTDTIIGFRQMDKLQLLSSLCGKHPCAWIYEVGADLSSLLLGDDCDETELWKRRRDSPFTSSLISLVVKIFASLWTLLTVAAMSYNFWEGNTTPYCLLLLFVTAYSKSP